jgi:hypothetical protein
MVTVNVQHTQNNGGFAGLMERMQKLKKRRIMVGIPEKKAAREGEPINNAQLLYILSHGVRKKSMREEMQPKIDAGMKYSAAYQLYIMSHGSPLWHIPPRPVLEPALEAHAGAIGKLFQAVIKAACKGDEAAMQKAMNICGMAAQNYCRDWFSDPRNGWAPNSPLTIKLKKSERPMVDTGTMRKAITYVIKEG